LDQTISSQKTHSTLDIQRVREHFPSLTAHEVFFDNPGGTQVAHESMERMRQYFLRHNANHGGLFRTTRESDAEVAEARRAVAAFLNAARPEEIIFGQNMTSLTLHISRSIARLLSPGDEIVVTKLDHDANIAPWLLIAEDRGCTVRWVDIDPRDCTLDMASLEQAIGSRTKLVAIGYASNAVGTINDVQRAVALAHSVGALCFIDAVQYAPHKLIDVQALDCDLLACSAYKFFGPHLGILYGKYDLLDRLTAYKVRPAGNLPPDKFETGTQSFESIAATLGVMEYLAWLGTTFGNVENTSPSTSSTTSQRVERAVLERAMQVIDAYELELNSALLGGLTSVPGLHLYGISDPQRMNWRVPTFSFTLDGKHPDEVAAALASQGINVWNGNYYALSVMERLDLERQGGMVRVGLTHYNTLDEIDHLVASLRTLA
jgi:cysteine desulfurase family protein (TIGR01976 family)